MQARAAKMSAPLGLGSNLLGHGSLSSSACAQALPAPAHAAWAAALENRLYLFGQYGKIYVCR
jgi:hypothetical protein